MQRIPLAILLLAACLTACSASPLDSPTPIPSPAPPRADSTPTPESTTAGPLPRALSLWVPPRFSPDGANEASALLAARLVEFESSHPGVRIEVRVKAQTGSASLTAALHAARQAAPSVLPDLVVFDTIDLLTTHASSMISVWEKTATIPETWGWISSVADAARSGGLLLGLPFAAQADAFAYRTVAFPAPPRSWAATLAGSGSFLFPAGDPNSLFTLGQYLSAGGTLGDADGEAALDAGALQAVLEFYAAARSGGLLPLSSRQYEDALASMPPLLSGQVGAAVVPYDRLHELDPLEFSVSGPWPSRDGTGTCFVTAWSWALVDRPAGVDPLAIELASWLTSPEFAGPWTNALNLLPATTSALDLWPDDEHRALAQTMGLTCMPLPSPEDLARFGPVLRQATGATLTGERTPAEAAQAAVDAIRSP